jgi:hypothetical protein
MTLSATKVVPDLLFYTQRYVINSVTNKYGIPFSDTFSEVYLGDNKSFIRLLFDESWPTDSTSYTYLFREETSLTGNISDTLIRRMMVYSSNSKLYICDSSEACTNNIFGLEEDDLTLLNKLLTYRIDSSSCIITDIVYDNLETVLSKLIYIYLNFKINNIYTLFDNSEPLSRSSNILENFYESFIVETIFNHLTSLST